MTHASLPIPSVSTPPSSPTSPPPGDGGWISLLWQCEAKCLDREKLRLPTAEEEEETGKVMSGADFHIGGSVEMKEVLQYPSHLLEQSFFFGFFFTPTPPLKCTCTKQRHKAEKTLMTAYECVFPLKDSCSQEQQNRCSKIINAQKWRDKNMKWH